MAAEPFVFVSGSGLVTATSREAGSSRGATDGSGSGCCSNDTVALFAHGGRVRLRVFAAGAEGSAS